MTLWTVGLAFLSKLGNAGMTFLVLLCAARWMETKEFAAFGLALSTGTFLGWVTIYGQNTLLAKTLPPLFGGKVDLILPLIKRARGTVLGFSAGVSGVFVLLGVLCAHLGFSGLAWLSYAGLYALPIAFAELQSATYRSEGSVVGALYPRDVIWPVTTLGLLFVVYAQTGDVGYEMAVALHVGVLVFALLGQELALRASIPRPGRPAPAVARTGEWWRSSFWFWLAAIAPLISAQLAVTAVSLVATAQDTAAFFASYRIALLISLPLIAINMVATRLIARGLDGGDLAAVQSLLRLGCLALCICTAVGCLVLFVLDQWLLGLFDPGFIPHAPVFRVLVVAYAIHTIAGPTMTAMLLTGHSRRAVMVTLPIEILVLGLIPVVIPGFGLLGAAYVVALGLFLSNGYFVYHLRRHARLDPSPLQFLRAP